MSGAWWTGAAAGVALGGLLRWTRVVTLTGAIAGAVLTCAFVGGGGVPAFLGFALLVLAGSVTSRVGGGRKRALFGGRFERDLRRHGGQALANAGPAAALLFALPSPGAVIAALGALGAATSDTVSSELGVLSDRRPRLLLVGPPAAHGRDGAMTPAGTLAGMAAALLCALGAAISTGRSAAFLPVAVGALAGNLTDSLLGASVEPRLPRSLANEAVNAAASTLGGAVAWWLLPESS